MIYHSHGSDWDVVFFEDLFAVGFKSPLQSFCFGTLVVVGNMQEAVVPSVGLVDMQGLVASWVGNLEDESLAIASWNSFNSSVV